LAFIGGIEILVEVDLALLSTVFRCTSSFFAVTLSSPCIAMLGVEILRFKPSLGFLASPNVNKLGMGAVTGAKVVEVEGEGEWYELVRWLVFSNPGRTLDTLFEALRPLIPDPTPRVVPARSEPCMGGGSSVELEASEEVCSLTSSREFSRDITGARGGVYVMVDVRERERYEWPFTDKLAGRLDPAWFNSIGIRLGEEYE
jgi:hypothetical protein